MTTTTSVLARHLILNLVVQTGAMAFLGLPSMAPHRDALANTLGLTQETAWIPVALCAVAVTIFSLRSLRLSLAAPMRDISEQCKSGQLYTIHRGAQTAEEKLIREYLLQLQVRGRDMATKLEQAENELVSVRKDRERAIGKRDEYEDLLAEFSRIRQELSIDNATLRAERESLAEMLDLERRAKITSEVVKRSEQIRQQMETAVSSAAVKSIWLPRLISELRTPVTIVKGLAHRMVHDWDHTTLAQLRQSADEILHQCEVQYERLQGLPQRLVTPNSPNGATEWELDQSDEEPTDPFRDLVEGEAFKGFDISISVPDLSPSDVPDSVTSGFLRALCHYFRNQLEKGSIRIAVSEDEDQPASFEVKIAGGSPRSVPQQLEAIKELASRHGVAADSSGAANGDLRVTFPLRLETAAVEAEELPRFRH